MTAEVIYGENSHLIGRYRRLVVVDDAGDLNPGERAQALNHVLRFASLSSSVAVFEEGVEGEHRGFIFNVRLGEHPSKTIHVTVYRRQAVSLSARAPGRSRGPRSPAPGQS